MMAEVKGDLQQASPEATALVDGVFGRTFTFFCDRSVDIIENDKVLMPVNPFPADAEPAGTPEAIILSAQIVDDHNFKVVFEQLSPVSGSCEYFIELATPDASYFSYDPPSVVTCAVGVYEVTINVTGDQLIDEPILFTQIINNLGAQLPLSHSYPLKGHKEFRVKGVLDLDEGGIPHKEVTLIQEIS